MAQIKYSYCLNENNELVHIGEVTVDNRHSHTFYCLECGQNMVTKIGKIKKPHFAHAKDTACDGESYLHKLAKRRIRDKFISSDSFPLTLVCRHVPCKDSSQCKFYDKFYCIDYEVPIERDLKKFNGNVVYDTCREEVNVGEFRPDLLLTGPIEKLGVLFIEIFKTHASEEPKLNSEYKIIETTKIKSEEDIDDIINRGFVEGENCKTYNFSPKMPSIRMNDKPVCRFVLFNTGAATFKYVKCNELNHNLYKDSFKELNVRREIEINKDTVFFNSLQKCLAYLRKKGLGFKNCLLCKYYKLNFRGDDHICVLYKTLGAQTTRPKQTQASKCIKYEENSALMNIPISELEKYISDVCEG